MSTTYRVIENAARCPFCGQRKIFLKLFVEGVHRKRYAISLRCSSSKCGIHGPQIFSDWVSNQDYYEHKLEPLLTEELIAKAVERWNTRCSED